MTTHIQQVAVRVHVSDTVVVKNKACPSCQGIRTALAAIRPDFTRVDVYTRPRPNAKRVFVASWSRDSDATISWPSSSDSRWVPTSEQQSRPPHQRRDTPRSIMHEDIKWEWLDKDWKSDVEFNRSSIGVAMRLYAHRIAAVIMFDRDFSIATTALDWMTEWIAVAIIRCSMESYPEALRLWRTAHRQMMFHRMGVAYRDQWWNVVIAALGRVAKRIQGREFECLLKSLPNSQRWRTAALEPYMYVLPIHLATRTLASRTRLVHNGYIYLTYMDLHTVIADHIMWPDIASSLHPQARRGWCDEVRDFQCILQTARRDTVTISKRLTENRIQLSPCLLKINSEKPHLKFAQRMRFFPMLMQLGYSAERIEREWSDAWNIHYSGVSATNTIKGIRSGLRRLEKQRTFAVPCAVFHAKGQCAFSDVSLQHAMNRCASVMDIEDLGMSSTPVSRSLQTKKTTPVLLHVNSLSSVCSDNGVDKKVAQLLPIVELTKYRRSIDITNHRGRKMRRLDSIQVN